MILTANNKNNFDEEKQFLRGVFEKEERGDEQFFVYNYDQRYYKVLSACAKLRLKTRNLPEGNPHYIEIKGEDWNRIMGQADEKSEPPKKESNAEKVVPLKKQENRQAPEKARNVENKPTENKKSFSIFDDEEESYDPFAKLESQQNNQKNKSPEPKENLETEQLKPVAGSKAEEPQVDQEDIDPDIEAAIQDIVNEQEQNGTLTKSEPSLAIDKGIKKKEQEMSNQQQDLANQNAEQTEQSSQDLFQGSGKRLEALRQREKAVQIREQAVTSREEELDNEEQKVLQQQNSLTQDENRLNEQRRQIEDLRSKVNTEQQDMKKAKESLERLSSVLQATLSDIS